MNRISIIAIFLGVIIMPGLTQCPEKTGRFPVSGQCDAYIECVDGVSEEKLCPDGLLFNDKVSPMAYPCQYPIDVSCENRGKTQPAQATDECPHQFGYYRLGDASDCSKFMNCAAGRSFVFECPEGLAFDKENYRCDWPDQVPDCNAEQFLGFTCPQAQKSNELGPEETRFYRSSKDCRHYFVCIEGHPRLLDCGEDRAFNELINACDGAVNVTGSLAARDPNCLEDDGKFIDPEQCDAYYDCEDGVGTWKLCPDGLRFNPKMGGNCVYKPAVFCGNRTKLQSPQPTKNCKRQFGFYRVGDTDHCGQYMNCAHGIGKLTTCPEGLAFNEKTYKCDWPDEAEDCDPEAFLSFDCPPAAARNTNSEGTELLRYYRHEENCFKYYVCDNEHPRLYKCAAGLVFNENKKACHGFSDIEDCNPKHKEPKPIPEIERNNAKK